MPHHFTKSTVSAVFWCKKCARETEHRVLGGRRGPCVVCLAKLDSDAAARKTVAKPAVQLGMFGGEDR
jgi:hypothetical protein